MLAFIGAILRLIPIFWSIWQKIEGSPEEKRAAFHAKIHAAFQKAEQTRGDTGDIERGISEL